MKRKYISIVLAVLIITFMVSFPMVSCKQVALETTAAATATTAAQSTVVTTIETTAVTTAAATAATTAVTTAATTAITTAATTASTETETTSTQEQQQIIYTNTQYGFSFSLPLSWEGYSIVTTKWEGNPAGSDSVIEQGPIVSIRNPKWTSANPYQDIPIMIFTLAQWNSLQQDKFHIGAGPEGPGELGRNTKYVFGLPFRYNYSFPTGYQEVDKILQGNPLKTF